MPQLIAYDSADHFRDPEAQDELLADALASGDHHYIAHAIGVVARARGISDVAKATGIKRQALYRAFSRDGNPTLETLVKVTDALGLRLSIGHVPA